MLDKADSLLTIAEVAVAFAGFASIVSVVGRQAGVGLPSSYRWPLRGMIACSLSVLFAALFPLLPDWFGQPEATTWRLSGGFLAISSAVLLLGGMLDSKALIETQSLFVRSVWLTPVAISAAIGTTLATGWFSEHFAAWFLTGLLSQLLLAGLLFGNIVMSQIAPRD